MKEKRVASFVAGALILAGAALLCVSLFSAVFALPGDVTDLSFPGSVLFSVYGFSSFLVPFFFLYASLLLLVPGWTVRSGIILALSFVPFLTAAGGEALIKRIGLTIGNPSTSRVVTGGLLLSTALAIIVEYILFLFIADRIAAVLPKANARKAVPANVPAASVFEEAPVADGACAPPETVPFAEATLPAEAAEAAVQAEAQALREQSLAEEITSRDEAAPFMEPEMAAAKTPDDAALPDASDAHVFLADIQADPPPLPTYVDFEKMRAPFDLPVIEEWVAPDEEDDPVSVVLPADIPADDAVGAGEGEPFAVSPSVAAFDPPVMDDFDDEPVLDEDIAVDEEDELDAESDLEGIDEITKGPADEIGGKILAESLAPPAALDETGLPPVLSVPPATRLSDPAALAPPPLKLFMKRQRKTYTVPFDILTSYPDGEYWLVDDATRRAAAALKETLNEFKIEADVTGIRKGPVITMFEILPAPGVKLSKIVGLQDNIALRLAASSVRIVAPIPGKHAVGIEVPNLKRSIVSFRELIEADNPQAKKMEIPVVLGKDITGEAQLLDLSTTPHLLIAGSTGSGKSVCVNAIILSILYKRSPEDVKLILIDPKIVELKLYNDIAHLLAPVITEPKKAFQALQYCLCEMERRYALLDGMGVRDIKSYNRRIKERNIATEKLPYIVIIIDEFADLMATTGKELESTVARLCAMSRAVGIHLVLATQRPSIDVITGLIKANIPSRIAFMVASKMDSRIIIDQVGAEKLLGRGDMLYAGAVDPFPVRIQGAFVSEEEVERVVEHVKTLGEPEYIDDEMFVEDDEDGDIDPSLFSDGDDPLYDKALEIVMLAGKASASYIQRRLKIGYNRAARLVEEMEERGIVGPANGSKPREVIHHI